MNTRVIARLTDLGVSLFRINLSHTPLDAVEEAIAFIQERTAVPVCLDSEGAQIRTGSFSAGPTTLAEHSIVRVAAGTIAGDAGRFSLTPEGIAGQFRVGDFLSIDFNSVLVQVVGVEDGETLLRVVNGGLVGNNKAVTLERDVDMPALSEKDVGAMKIGLAMGVRHFALSFANRGSDVDAIRALVGPDSFIISKIECLSGLRNLADITLKSDAILIDRGDLSRQVPVERVPAAQKKIIRTGKALDRKVYVATNFLESMIAQPAPTRAEVNDIYNTFVDGADGLVLAAETAIGRHPVESARVLASLIGAFEQIDRAGDFDSAFNVEPVSLLADPHGGQLVHQEATAADRDSLAEMPAVTVDDDDLMDCEQIAIGTYSPLTGFMDQDTLESVLFENRLPDGTVWTLPVVLQLDDDAAGKAEAGRRIILKSRAGVVHSLLDVTAKFAPDLDKLMVPWFGTDSSEHPGVRRARRRGRWFVAGKVTLVERLPSAFRQFELTPRQTRAVFAHKGWSRVVGFHTRNPAHQAHRQIQLQAVERSHADGLYVSPVIGPRKPGDFLPGPIMESYQMLLRSGAYDGVGVVLGGFSTYARYAGPREAVFTALCRKNMGCSHFVVGRDHTGVGNFYAPTAAHQLFEKLGDIGIEPLYFEAIGYDTARGEYAPIADADTVKSISGTQVRDTLRRGEHLPSWFMDDKVQDMFLAQIADGEPVFFEDESAA